MEGSPLDKAAVEAVPLGNLTLSIEGSSFWSEDDRIGRLGAIASELVKAVSESAFCAPLVRAIVVASDYKGVAARWQECVDSPRGTTEFPEGSSGAMTFLWGSGDLQQTYALIIMQEQLAYQLLVEEPKSRALGRGCLAHELAHVHDRFIRVRTIGIGAAEVDSRDWTTMRQAAAIAIWREFFAQYTAYEFFNGYWLEEETSRGSESLAGVYQRVRHAIALYRESADMEPLWRTAVYEHFFAFEEIGRSLGFLLAARQQDSVDQMPVLFRAIDAMSESWGNVVRQMATELDVLLSREDRTRVDFEPLGDCAEHGFNATGLYPRLYRGGLWIDVP